MIEEFVINNTRQKLITGTKIETFSKRLLKHSHDFLFQRLTNEIFIETIFHEKTA